jgi:RNA polymerase sigma factor (sigma-70 family)
MSKHVLNIRLPPTASLRRGRHAELSRQADGHNPSPHPGALRAFGPAVCGTVRAGAFREDAPPDDRLVLRDEEALLAELYRSESPKLVRILSRQTSSNADAQDLVQDVFFRFARMRGRWPSSLERPQAYLRRIASNLLKNRAKADFRHSAAMHVVADEEVLQGLDQDRLLESRDMLRRLEAAMMRLRPRTREIFMAHRIDGMSYAEIAEQTGLTIKGVEKQMSKALAQLDRILNRY